MHSFIKNNSFSNVRDLSAGVFIDNSGSTAGHILNLEKEFIKYFSKVKQINYVQWNTKAVTVHNIDKIISYGCTDPSCIFDNAGSFEVYKKSDVIILITDGEIPQEYVKKFNDKVLELNKCLIIGVIISPKKNVDISVLAPLMNFSNVLLLQYAGGPISKILYNKNIDIKTYQAPEGDVVINTPDILDININSVYANFSANHIIIEETADVIKYIEIDDLLNNKLPKDIYENLDWDAICRRAKTGGFLQEIRKLINTSRNEEISKMNEEIQNILRFNSNNILKQDLIRQINNARDANKDYSELSKKLRELNLNHNNDGLIKEKTLEINKIKAKWDKVYRVIFHYEKSDYTLNNFVYSSNRVNRAEKIPEYEFITPITYSSDAPKIDCCICCDEGPAVLWLTNLTPAQNELIFNDYSLNYGLGLRTKTYMKIFDSVIVPNHVCGYCAENYIAVSDISVYRTPLSGYIPIEWDNLRTINMYIYKYFTGGRILPHIKLMLFSYIDVLYSKNLYKNKMWLSSNVKEFCEYFLNQMLTYIITNNTLSEEGDKCNLRDAINAYPIIEDYLLRQPIEAVTRILHYSNKTYDEKIVILTKRLYYYYIEKFCIYAKKDAAENNTQNIRDHLNNILCNTWCGMLKLDNIKDVKTTKNIHFDSRTLFVFDDDMPYFVNEMNDIISENETRFLLHYLTINDYNKPLKLFNNFKFKDLTKEQYYNIIKGRYYVHNLEDNKNAYSPCYAFYNGLLSSPSKFYYNKIFLGDKPAEELKKEISARLKKEYGNDVPNSKTAHINMHKMVADVIENKFSDTNKYTPEMALEVIEKIKNTDGKKGNIYYSFYKEIILCIIDFLIVRQEYRDKKKMGLMVWDIDKNADFIKRVEIEREFCDILKCPGMLEERYMDLNVDDLLKEVEHLYNNKRNQNNIQKDIKKTLYDKNEYSIMIQNDKDLFDKWQEEQNKISKEVKTEDSINFDEITYIAGCDISFHKDEERAVASMVIMNIRTYDVECEVSIKCRTNIPYKSGYLAFREAPILMKLLEKVKEEYIQYLPELIIMDGNGIYHPRRCGIASHFGVLSGIPCIGISKNVLYVDNITREEMWRQQEAVKSEKMDMVDIKNDKGEVLCAAFNTTGFYKNSTYISVGSGISLETSKKIIMKLGAEFGYKVCEPVRLADKLSRSML